MGKGKTFLILSKEVNKNKLRFNQYETKRVLQRGKE